MFIIVIVIWGVHKVYLIQCPPMTNFSQSGFRVRVSISNMSNPLWLFTTIQLKKNKPRGQTGFWTSSWRIRQTNFRCALISAVGCKRKTPTQGPSDSFSSWWSANMSPPAAVQGTAAASLIYFASSTCKGRPRAKAKLCITTWDALRYGGAVICHASCSCPPHITVALCVVWPKWHFFYEMEALQIIVQSEGMKVTRAWWRRNLNEWTQKLWFWRDNACMQDFRDFNLFFPTTNEKNFLKLRRLHSLKAQQGATSMA